jgi:hypothetical protein
MSVAIKKTSIPKSGKNKKAFSKDANAATSEEIKKIDTLIYEGTKKINAQISDLNANIKQLQRLLFENSTDNPALEAIEAAGKEASANAMEIMGYAIIEEKGWLVKKHSDGHKEKISKI